MGAWPGTILNDEFLIQDIQANIVLGANDNLLVYTFPAEMAVLDFPWNTVTTDTS